MGESRFYDEYQRFIACRRGLNMGTIIILQFLPIFPYLIPCFCLQREASPFDGILDTDMREESHSSLISRNILLTQAMLVLICYVKNVRNHNEFVPTQFLFSLGFLWHIMCVYGMLGECWMYLLYVQMVNIRAKSPYLWPVLLFAFLGLHFHFHFHCEWCTKFW